MTEWIKWQRKGQWVDNDEGYHYRYCGACGGKAEHDFNGCVDCHNRALRKRMANKPAPVFDGIVNREFIAGTPYLVTLRESGKKVCNCKGYIFRKKCKHLEMTTKF